VSTTDTIEVTDTRLVKRGLEAHLGRGGERAFAKASLTR